MRKAKRAAARRGRRLRIMFADEARFGRINQPRPCWAPVGIRPEVASQLIREYVYLYGAVSPKDGTCVYLIISRVPRFGHAVKRQMCMFGGVLVLGDEFGESTVVFGTREKSGSVWRSALA